MKKDTSKTKEIKATAPTTSITSATPVTVNLSDIAIDPINKTMKSTDLHEIVFNNTGKYEKLKAFHRKIKNVLEIQSNGDGAVFAPSLDSRGYVKHYNLDETECHMIMASVDSKHLRMVVTIFIEARKALSPLPPAPLSPAEILIQQGYLMLKVEQEQARLAKEQELINSRLANLEQRLIASQTQLNDGWWTIRAYASINNVQLDMSLAMSLSKACAEHSMKQKVEIHTKIDSTHGRINQFQEDVLRDVFITKGLFVNP
jgi:hypothetical protein